MSSIPAAATAAFSRSVTVRVAPTTSRAKSVRCGVLSAKANERIVDMPVITPEQAPVFEAPGATIRGLASPSRGATDVPAGRVPLDGAHETPRRSRERQEVFVVLAGTLTARYDGHSETAGEGGALIVPPDTEFSLIGP